MYCNKLCDRGLWLLSHSLALTLALSDSKRAMWMSLSLGWGKGLLS